MMDGGVLLFVYYFRSGQVILGIPAWLGPPAGVRQAKKLLNSFKNVSVEFQSSKSFFWESANQFVDHT